MNRIGRMILSAGWALAGAAWADAPAATAAPVAATSAPSPVARGAYLAAICGCAGCHTPFGAGGSDLSRLYAGQQPRPGGKEGGTPNITPDPETGIGKWTDAQIAAAIREGKDEDGKPLSPHMPSAAYHGMTDADVAALVAYLRSVKPIVNKITEAEEHESKGGMKPEVLPPAVGNVDPAGDPVKHGSYIAALMRCQGCHTPRKGALKGKLYAGGNEFGMGPQGGKIFSANITSDTATGIGMWKPEDVVASLKELVRPDGTKLKGPMNWFKDAYAQITDSDVAAVAAFVKAIPPVKNKVPLAIAPAAPKGEAKPAS